MHPGDMVEWWNEGLAATSDKKFGLVIRLDERSGRPGAWIMWNDNKQPMWSPKEMLRILDRGVM